MHARVQPPLGIMTHSVAAVVADVCVERFSPILGSCFGVFSCVVCFWSF